MQVKKQDESFMITKCDVKKESDKGNCKNL